MKVLLPHSLNRTSVSAYQRIFRNFYASKSRNLQHLSFDGSDNLYRRISPLGDPRISITPVLDQWVREGKSVQRNELTEIVKELKWHNRFGHALEVSEWMTDKRYMPLTAADVAMRIHLIFKLDGIKAVEDYFNCVSEQLKGFEVNTAMLNCYAHDKDVEKADAIMQKVRMKDPIRSPLPYNIMMNINCGLGNWNKIDDLMREMQESGINFDSITYSIRLKAYAENSDTEGVDKIVHVMERDPHITMDCNTCSAIAQAYMKVGHLDKVLSVLKKMEGLAVATTRNIWYDFLLKTYSEVGRKDDVYRIWNVYKEEKKKIYNKGYISMMSSLSKFNDVEGMEKIFEEWEDSGLSYDFRVINTLVNAYCRNGEIGKAEDLVEKGLLEGRRPFSTTWYDIAEGYLKKSEIVKGVEALGKAADACGLNDRPSKEALSTILGYLQGREDSVKEEEFLRVLKAENLFVEVGHDRLLQFVGSK